MKIVTVDAKHKIEFYINGIHLGDAFKDEAGYYTFTFTESAGGSWDAYVLREIANKLDELNKEWNDYINKNLKV